MAMSQRGWEQQPMRICGVQVARAPPQSVQAMASVYRHPFRRHTRWHPRAPTGTLPRFDLPGLLMLIYILYCAARRRPVPGPILHEEEGSEKYILVLTPNHTLTSEGMVT